MAGAIIAAALAASAWIYLLLFRGRFWLIQEREDVAPPAVEPQAWPRIVAVVPARNEACMLPTTLATLFAQIRAYPGELRIVLVDDHRTDATAQTARDVARRQGQEARIDILPAAPLPAGWTGKLWALAQGVAHARSFAPDLILLTDADIAYGPGALRRLAARALRNRYALTSVMVKLRCDSPAERALVPAFVFFFRMLYPFRWVNDPRRRTAAAAGGCMLARADALEAAGGIESIRSALIDDCALGRRLKAQGPVWLGMSADIISARPYPALSEIGAMISRSAYAQLRYSPALLFACVTGMGLVYLAPPIFALFGSGWTRGLGLLAWAAMGVAFAPIARFYRRSPLWGLALPAIASMYLVYTLKSALEHRLGRGGMWKGRAQAIPEA